MDSRLPKIVSHIRRGGQPAERTVLPLGLLDGVHGPVGRMIQGRGGPSARWKRSSDEVFAPFLYAVALYSAQIFVGAWLGERFIGEGSRSSGWRSACWLSGPPE